MSFEVQAELCQATLRRQVAIMVHGLLPLGRSAKYKHGISSGHGQQQ